jgi:two-component system sensor histidine kinase VicK
MTWKKNLFDVIAKVKIVIERLKPFNRDKEFKIVTNTNELMVNTDDVKFFQIVHNLLSNAVKFTPSHGHITVQIKKYESFFEVSVADTGIGIPEHLQPYIFHKNTLAARVGLKGEKSIGMGLYVVRKLIEKMLGQVSFKSRENAGTTFLVRLPRE